MLSGLSRSYFDQNDKTGQSLKKGDTKPNEEEESGIDFPYLFLNTDENLVPGTEEPDEHKKRTMKEMT